MIAILVVTHEAIGSELIKATKHIVGDLPKAKAVDFIGAIDLDEKRAEITDLLHTMHNEYGTIIITDIYGGTPANLALEHYSPEKIEVICGANLPMLVALAKSRHLSLTEAIQKAMAAGRKHLGRGRAFSAHLKLMR